MSDQSDDAKTISDGDLVAYLDGELEGGARVAVETAVAADESLRARLETLRAGDRPFRAGFDALLDSAPTQRLQDILATAEVGVAQATASPVDDGAAARWRRPAALAASLLLAVGIGYLAGQIPGGGGPSAPTETARSDPAGAWRLAVAEYQALYTRETLANLTGSRDQQEAGLKRVGAALGLTLPVERITVPELDYKRAQILRFDDQPLAQLAYLHAGEIPVAFCITRSDHQDQARQSEQLKGLNVVHWIKDGFAFMVIGALPEGLLDRIGRRLADGVG